MAEKSNATTPTESVSSPQEDNKPSGGWWDSWISSAKSKSAEVYSMVKKDLDEIGTAVKSEATHVFSTTSNVIGKTLKLDEPESTANVMKKSFSTFIGQVNTVLNPEPDDEDDTEVILSSGDTTMLSTYKKELEALQRVDATFIVSAYSPEFEAWRTSLDSTESVVSPSSAVRRLRQNPVLRAQYDKLVPDAVSHDDFWERYLFRVALLQDKMAAAARKQTVEEPTTDPVLAHLTLQSEPVVIESPKKVIPTPEIEEAEEPADLDKVSWEDEEFTNQIELSEEQQTLLLEEYEKELSLQSQKQTTPRDKINNNTKNKETTAKTGTKTKSAQTRDKLNNRQIEKKQNTKGKGQQNIKKSDVCGNNLVEDYFGNSQTSIKDDASANSDESWEKEFDIEEAKDLKN